VNSCILSGNSAGTGGGAAFGMLNNCTLTENSAWRGGGAWAGAMNNCIVFYNTATNDPNYYQDPFIGAPGYCCITPMPTNGIGNFTNAPLFVDPANSNFRLQPNSPCINAGDNNYVTNITDLDGNARISGGTVDIGAYEFVFTPSMLIAQLMVQIEQANPGVKNKQSLLATLAAVRAAIERGNTSAALNQLSAFQNKVRAQVAPANAALADELVALVREIIVAPGGP